MCWGTEGGASGTTPLTAVLSVTVHVAVLPEKVRKSRAIYALMRKNNIDLRRIIETEFKEQLEAKQVFASIAETNGDATFTLEIWSYGLVWDSRGVSWAPYPLKPRLTVICERVLNRPQVRL
jgi:hypothetical protein